MKLRVYDKISGITSLFVGSLIVILSISVLVSFAQAQPTLESQSLEVSPPSQEITVDPGQTIEVKAKIHNKTDKELVIAARLEDFIPSGNEGQIALTEKGPWGVSSWSSLQPTNFVLKAGETKEAIATVRVPQTGVAGGRYGSFVFSVSGASEPGKAALSQEIASLFLLDISGPREEKLAITTFQVPEFLEFGPVPFTITYKNSGNVHMKAHGVVAVTDMFGRKVTDVLQIGTNVFPGAERQVTVNWEKKFLFGRYNAEAIINTGGTNNQTLTATTSFVVFPIRIAAIIVLIITFLFLIRQRLKKALKALLGK